MEKDEGRGTPTGLEVESKHRQRRKDSSDRRRSRRRHRGARTTSEESAASSTPATTTDFESDGSSEREGLRARRKAKAGQKMYKVSTCFQGNGKLLRNDAMTWHFTKNGGMGKIEPKKEG